MNKWWMCLKTNATLEGSRLAFQHCLLSDEAIMGGWCEGKQD